MRIHTEARRQIHGNRLVNTYTGIGVYVWSYKAAASMAVQHPLYHENKITLYISESKIFFQLIIL